MSGKVTQENAAGGPVHPSEARLAQIETDLHEIKGMLREILFLNSPASLDVEEKARIISRAMKQGKGALKEAVKMINKGMQG